MLKYQLYTDSFMNFPGKLHYEIKSNWDKGTGGIANSGRFNIAFDTPEEFGGMEKAPCPDQLFLASICGCLMNTFLSFKRRFRAETKDLGIEAEMSVDHNEKNGYRIKEIRVSFRIMASEDQLNINRRCAELARDFCHITQSINSIPIKFDVELIKV
jgi:organic hydroperoxide reductase OsmC/OhrA